MNPIEHREPVFPLAGSCSNPRAMHAPRLSVRLTQLVVGERIFPGAWSAQHAPTGGDTPRWCGFTRLEVDGHRR